jgi:hypothetical protein
VQHQCTQFASHYREHSVTDTTAIRLEVMLLLLRDTAGQNAWTPRTTHTTILLADALGEAGFQVRRAHTLCDSKSHTETALLGSRCTPCLGHKQLAVEC